jgi:hypothetical protein
MTAAPFTHVWFWRPRWGAAEKNRRGMLCRVLKRGGKNTILVELEDGELVFCSRFAVRARGRQAARLLF